MEQEVVDAVNSEAVDSPAVQEGEYPGAYSVEDFPNLAEYTDKGEPGGVVQYLLERAGKYYKRYDQQIQEWWDEVGSKADLIYRCYRSDSERKDAQTDETEANTGSSLGFVAVRVLASQICAVALGREDPLRYVPVISEDAGYKAEDGDLMARQYGLLDRYARKQEGFEEAFIDAVWKLVKYENLPLAFRMKRERAKRIFRLPTMDDEGKITGFKLEERDVMVANYPTWSVIPPENFLADRHGDDLSKKPCVIVKDFCTRADLLEGKRKGEYQNIDLINESYLYTGSQKRSTATEDRKENAAQTHEQLDEETGIYQLNHVWMRLPVNSRGKIDKNAEPRWHWAQVVGDMEQSKPVVISIIKNPDPDDQLPYLMWHHLPDDSDMLHHMGIMQAVEADIDEAVTTKNQAIDQKSLMVRRPLKVVEGECYDDDLTFSQDKIFHVDNKDSVTDFQMQNVFPDTIQCLDRIESDLRRASGADKPITGDAMGGRTSATEAQNIFEQALKPQAVLMKYTLHQFFNFIGRKRYRYWQRFADPSQVVEISGAEQRFEIRPRDLWGEFDTEIEIVTEFEESAAMIQGMQYVLTQIGANPEAAKVLDFRPLLKDMLEKMHVTRNAAKYMKPLVEADAERVAEMETRIMMDAERPEYVEVQEVENRAAHLKIHRAKLHQYQALPQKDRPRQLEYLELHVAETERLYQEEQNATGGMGAPPEAPPTPGTNGELAGDAIAARAGAEAGRPPIAETQRVEEPV